MFLDLSKLREPREHVARTFDVFDTQDDEYRVVAPVELSLDIEKARGEAFQVSGRVRTRLELSCSRCLEAFEVPVDTDFELRYVPQTENAGESEREIAEDDLTTAYYREGMLDIGDLLREQLQLALPMKPLCREACRGLCPECGTNLNRATCDCVPKWEGARLAPLKGLLNREKES
jgi:uncharacterized protein